MSPSRSRFLLGGEIGGQGKSSLQFLLILVGFVLFLFILVCVLFSFEGLNTPTLTITHLLPPVFFDFPPQASHTLCYTRTMHFQ